MRTASAQLDSTVQILGIRFFNSNVDEAVASICRHGGFVVAPSGTCFARLREDESYRRAVLAADLTIADSGLMVVLWRLLQCEKVHRISGLKYLKHLLGRLKGEGILKFFGCSPVKARDKNCSSGRAGEFFQSRGKIVTLRRGTDRKSKIEIFCP
jgi:UDP-N-acetyl-D-mannosaminuronic acid transferase (WecB/TagA/CpsF family)